MKNMTFIIIAVILVVVSIIGFKAYLPAPLDAAFKTKVSDFPMTVGEWRATEIPVSERDYQILETRNLFIREYKNNKAESVFLYVVYSEDNRKVSHPPEICLMGSGVTITDKTSVPITDNIRAVKLIVEKQANRELVAYWYKAAGLYTDKYLKQQLKIVTDRMFGRRTSGALIRLSTDMKDDNGEKALSRIKSFVSEIKPLLAKYVP